MTRQAVSSERAPAALGPYSQAIIAGGFYSAPGPHESTRPPAPHPTGYGRRRWPTSSRQLSSMPKQRTSSHHLGPSIIRSRSSVWQPRPAKSGGEVAVPIRWGAIMGGVLLAEKYTRACDISGSGARSGAPLRLRREAVRRARESRG